MDFKLPQKPKLGRTLGWTLLSSFLLAITLFLWEWETVGSSYFFSIPVFFVIFLTYFLYGRIALILFPFLSGRAISIPFLFILGFFTHNTLLFISFVIFPWPLQIDFVISLIAFAGIRLINKMDRCIIRKDSLLPSLYLLLASIATITLICRQWMAPYYNNLPPYSVISCYSDCFTHARYIQALADSPSSLFTIPALGDVSLKMPIYHYASYLFSSVVESILKTRPLDTLNYCLIPVGLLLAVGAMYSLIELRWGSWIGLIGGAAILLIPDGFYQGMTNKFYSFLYITIICPGLTYGIACAALAWLLVLRGVKYGNWRCILAGWAFALALAVYKAQLFIAISAPIFLYSICFYPRIIRSVRIVLLLATVIQALILMKELRAVSLMPTLVLDGSGVDYMIKGFIFSLDSYSVKTICRSMLEHHWTWGDKYIQMAIFETVAELGPIGIIILMLSFSFRWNWIDRWFLIFTIVTYYVMSLGLALNANGYAAEELIHRPFVWFYAVVICWGISGIMAALKLKKSFFRKRATRVWIAIFLGSYLFFPYLAGYNLQELPAWKKYFFAIPNDLLTCCYYVRDKTDKNAIILDSGGDQRLVISCLSERQDLDTLIPERTVLTDQEKALREFFKDKYVLAPEVAQFMLKHHVDYLVLEPGIALFDESPAIQVVVSTSSGFRLLHIIQPR